MENALMQVFHAPSFGDEDFELTTAPRSSAASAASDGGQQTGRTMERLQSSVNDDKSSPTSADTGCWSSPDVSTSPPPPPHCGDVDQRRLPHANFHHVTGRPDDAEDVCLLKLPPPDEFHVPDIRYAAEFYRCSQHHQHPHQQMPPGPSVTYSIPPPPRYPHSYAAGVMRPPPSAAGMTSESCVLLDRLPLRCDRAAAYTSSTPLPEYVLSPGHGGLCYNGAAGISLCADSASATADMLLRPDTVRSSSVSVSVTLHHHYHLYHYLWCAIYSEN